VTLTASTGQVAPPPVALPTGRPDTGAGTVVRAAPPIDDTAPERRRALSGWRASDLLAIVGAATGGAALTWLLFTELAPFSGLLGVVVVWYLCFITLYALLVSFDESGQAVKDRIASAFVHSLAAVLLMALVFVILYVVVRGIPALVHPNLYTKDLSVTGPLEPLTSGGVLHGVAGTLIEISIALVITVPLGITCAVFLSEFPGPFSRLVRTVVEAMTALPSVVAGLFVFSLYVLILGLPRSGFAAALALSVMSLPIIIRAADVVLRLVPGSLTEAGLALGASRWRTVWHVTLPTARSGLATAVILGTARAIGETSPVLLTAGYGNSLNLDPREGPMVSLPLLAYELRRIPEDAMITRSFGAGSVLLVIVLLLFGIARAIGGRGAGVLTPRQQARRERQSRKDAARLAAIARARAVAALPDLPDLPAGQPWT
jgi:phosphate transport system permease protein